MKKIAKLILIISVIVFSAGSIFSAEDNIEIPAFALPASYPGRGMKVFTVNSSWTVPGGVTRIRVELLGGGGSGNSGASGGGGAGGYINATIPVRSGDTLSFIVAAAQINQGSAGNSTKLTYGSMILTAYGGGGGGIWVEGTFPEWSNPGNGGAGGTGGGTNISGAPAGAVILGSKGGDGQTNKWVDYATINSGGGNGASSIYGGGGKGEQNGLGVGNGSYGAGGGGGFGRSSLPGGSGGQGLAIVYW
jgi:hypothetical protein